MQNKTQFFYWFSKMYNELLSLFIKLLVGKYKFYNDCLFTYKITKIWQQ